MSQKKTKKNCGCKRIQIDYAHFCKIPLSKRITFQSLAYALNTNKTSLGRLLKLEFIWCHSNAMKLTLKEENKVSQLQFCLLMLKGCRIPCELIFISMHNIIHIDEKWFHMTKKSKNYYFLLDEEALPCTCKRKNFIGNVIFQLLWLVQDLIQRE